MESTIKITKASVLKMLRALTLLITFSFTLLSNAYSQIEDVVTVEGQSFYSGWQTACYTYSCGALLDSLNENLMTDGSFDPFQGIGGGGRRW